MLTKNARGSALVEGLPVLTTVLVFALGILLVSYILFARAWLRYQSEQTLYCLAEAKSPALCRRQLNSRLERFLPWGQITSVKLQSHFDSWSVEVTWKFNAYRITAHKILRIRQALTRRDLRW